MAIDAALRLVIAEQFGAQAELINSLSSRDGTANVVVPSYELAPARNDDVQDELRTVERRL